MSDIVKQSTIGAKLRKLFSNNKQTVAENIPEEKEFPVPAAPIGSNPSADSGKVPTVQDDGSYALATPSGGSGGGAYYVNATVFNDTITIDKTYSEIEAAYNSGEAIILIDRMRSCTMSFFDNSSFHGFAMYETPAGVSMRHYVITPDMVNYYQVGLQTPE